MKVVIQRVSKASVEVNGEEVAAIRHGLLILLGVEHADQDSDADWLAQKCINLRIFGDGEGQMNLSLLDTVGEVLVVSQFTLHAQTKKGNRPSFIRAAKPEQALHLYTYFVDLLRQTIGSRVKTGIFRADMKVTLCNDGPVTIVIDSQQRE
jgi:D-aminoacyl-tRNA deacylase